MPSNFPKTSINSTKAHAFQPRLQSTSALVALVLAGVLILPNGAAAKDWDATQGNTTVDGGSGTWDASTTPNWTTTGGNTNVTFDGPGDATADFGATAGTVTVTGVVESPRLTFDTSGYNLAGAGSITNSAGDVNIILGSGMLVVLNTDFSGSNNVLLKGADATSNFALGGVKTTTGAISIDSGNLTSNVTSYGGSVIAKGTSTLTFTTSDSNVAGDIIINSSSATALEIEAGVEVTASKLDANAGTSAINGELVGDLDVASAATVNVASGGAVTGDTLNAGIVSNDGTMTGDVRNTNMLTSTDTITGDVINTATADVEGTLTGMVTNSGTFTATDTLGGITTFNNTGDFTVDSGTTTLTTLNVNAGSATVTGTLVGDANVAAAGTMTVDGTFTGNLVNDGTVDGSATITNADMITNNGSISNAITNNSVITGNGGTFDSAVTNTGGTIDMSNGITGEVLTFDGGLIGGTVSIDVDYGAGDGGMTQSDYVDLGGASSGTLTFDIVQDGSSLGVQASPIVIAVGTGSLTLADFDISSIPTGGSVLYTGEVTGGELVINSSANPAIGGISGGLSLVQSLLGTVINRPSSANVSAVAFDDEDGCNVGVWSRLSGGVAESTSTTTVDSAATETTLDADYRGLQLGSDWGCSDGRYSGWNLAYGFVGGVNNGTTSQDVFEGAVLTSIVENDFDQKYGGVYLSATKNGYIIDLQVRREKTDYSLLESTIGTSAGIGLNGVEFSSEALTASAAVSRAFYSEQLDMTLVPVIGVGWSDTQTDTIEFLNGESLETPDRTTKIGFAGISAVKSIVAPTGDSATNYFGTATLYNDFSDDTEATFSDGSGGVQELSTETIGAFGELSLGISYIKLYDVGANRLGARQMNLSARVDARANSNVSSYGLTLNARLTF